MVMERYRTHFRAAAIDAPRVFRALIRSIRRAAGATDRAQLALDLGQPAPRDAAELLTRLRALGLRHVDHLVLTRNRRTMVSVSGRTLRVHEAYLHAGEPVHAAIATFVMARRGAQRLAANRTIVEFARTIARSSGGRRAERTNPEDEPLAANLVEWHGKLNMDRFDGALTTPPIRVSRRMRSRLGHYSSARDGETGEIAISRRHIRRHGFAQAVQTLLHEMVHQWQDENGIAVDHGAAFKRKAREVGISPRATRVVD
jgi:hypothetical protein